MNTILPQEKYSYLVVASYPRSGNSWVRDIIYSCTVAPKYDDDVRTSIVHNNDKNFDESARLQLSSVKSISQVGDNSVFLLKTHAKHDVPEIINHLFATIHLVRHPLDVLASGINYFHLRGTKQAFYDGEVMTFDKLLAEGKIGKQIDFFIENGGFPPTKFRGTWSQHFNYWSSQTQGKKRLLVRYEDLTSDMASNFSKIFHLIGRNISAEQIEAAQHHLNAMREKKPKKEVWRRGNNYLAEIITSDQRKRMHLQFGAEMEACNYK